MIPKGWRQVSPYRYERDDGAWIEGGIDGSPFWRPCKDAVFVASESSPLKAMLVADDEWPAKEQRR